MDIRFIPTVCKPFKDEAGAETPARYDGHVTLRAPSYEERLDLYDRYGGEDEEAELSPKELASENRKRLKVIAAVLPEYVKEVSIKRLEDGFTFTSFDELRFDSEMVSVITELCHRLVGKNRVGNALPPS